MAWVDELAGQYECPALGRCEISRRGDGYWIQFAEWGGELGSEIEPGGGRLLRILSPPWRGGLKLVANTDGRTLTVDGGQSKYVFQKR